ncbi:MAG TPA: hypothetical protein VNA89_05935 [Gemmatimonadaceae bacterium]|nr:hypothetical protein [Gemmatimonadaceae bacterium]
MLVRRSRALPLAGALTLTLLAPATRLAAQTSGAPADTAARPTTGSTGGSADGRLLLGFAAGASQFDLSGTGTTPLVALRLAFEANRYLLLEAGLGAMRPEEQFGRKATCVLREAQVQRQLPGKAFRPYLGAGGGAIVAVEDDSGDTDTELTLSMAGGVRIPLGSGPILVTELRVRGIRSEFTGSAAEWTAGLTWRL